MRNLKKILAAVLALAMVLSFVTVPASAASISEDLAAANIELTREVAQEGMVLLENNGALPLAEGEKVAVLGGVGSRYRKGGNGSGDVTCAYITDVLEGMQQKEAEGKVVINDELESAYLSNNNYNPDFSALQRAASVSSTAIVTLDRQSSEGGDTSANDYEISQTEKDLLTNVNNAGFGNIIVILNVGRVIDTSWLKSQSYIDAILLAWQGGMEGGLAIADALVGDVNPSGKTVDTWATSLNAYTTTEHFNDIWWYTEYTEDVYVGYRYFETFDPEYKLVNYEFGYGLSYTTFDIETVKVAESEGNVVVTVDVTNTGDVAGKEVVQVYYSAPNGELGKPAKELAAFQKTKLLAPGEKQTLTITYAIDDMASYDDLGKISESAYVMEKGTYNIYVGNSIKNAGVRGVAGTHVEMTDRVTQQLTEQAEPLDLVQRMTHDGSGNIVWEELPTYQDIEELDSAFDVSATGVTRLDFENSYYKQRYSRIKFGTGSDGNMVSGIKIDSENDGQNFAWFDYILDVEKAGKYEVRVAMGLDNNTTLNNAFTIVLGGIHTDGAAQTHETVNLSSTGGRWNIQEWGPMTVTLPEGNVYFRLKVNTDSSVNGILDYISLVPVGEDYSAPETNLTKVDDPAQDVGLTFLDVMEDESKMDAFIDQFSFQTLANLLDGSRGDNAEGLDAAQGSIGSIDDYLIPAVQCCDGPAGVHYNNNANSTAWPVATMLACTWNPELIEEMGVAFGSECAEVGVDVILTPAVNIHRNPLCGRNFEYYSEDPLVSGIMAGALIRGIESTGVGTAVKHFVGNERESRRYYTETRVSERALREIYLKAFEVVVEEGNPTYIMTSYNRLNGWYTSESVDLCTNIVRGEWGWDGIFVTDWWNGANFLWEVIAGGDVKMENGEQSEIVGALQTGLLDLEVAQATAKRVLNTILDSNAPARLEELLKPIDILANAVNTISAPDFNFSSSAVRVENNGTSIGYFDNGAWMEYYLNVEEEAGYELGMIVATENRPNATIEVYIDDELVGTIRNTTGSASWTDWKEIEPVTINLPAGEHVMKLVAPTDSINIQTLTLTKSVEYTPGDVNNDGEVNVADMLKLKELILSGSWDIQQKLAGDMDQDGRLNVVDILLLKQTILAQ